MESINVTLPMVNDVYFSELLGITEISPCRGFTVLRIKVRRMVALIFYYHLYIHIALSRYSKSMSKVDLDVIDKLI